MTTRILACLIAVLLVAACAKTEGSYDNIQSTTKAISVNPNLVVYKGRWVLVSRSGEYPPVSKINTVEGVCERHTMTCFEATALLFTKIEYVSTKTGQLLPVQHQYKVIEWTPRSIYAREENYVSDVELKISLEGKTAEMSSRETKARGNETADPKVFFKYELR